MRAIKRASTDTTRKIATLRRMASRLQRGQTVRVDYLFEIADEMQRIYFLMLQARRGLLLVERFPKNSRLAALATKLLEQVQCAPR
jgi:hypothetical protein